MRSQIFEHWQSIFADRRKEWIARRVVLPPACLQRTTLLLLVLFLRAQRHSGTAAMLAVGDRVAAAAAAAAAAEPFVAQSLVSTLAHPAPNIRTHLPFLHHGTKGAQRG